ncbi:MAG: hypothetical protein AAGF75_11065, partial [Cyanobacteria bacterium P01_H01_bin.130]
MAPRAFRHSIRRLALRVSPRRWRWGQPWKYGLLALMGAIAALLFNPLLSLPGQAIDSLGTIPELSKTSDVGEGERQGLPSQAIAPSTSPELLLQRGQERYEAGYFVDAAQ